MIITKFKIADGYQLELTSRTYIMFTDVHFEAGEGIFLFSRNLPISAIYDPKSIEEFKAEWSKKK